MLEPFCNALKCGLVKHSRTFMDWWSIIFHNKAVNLDIDNINPQSINELETPLIFNIAKSWQTACIAFYETGSNVKNAPVLNNPLIKSNGNVITRIGNRITWINNIDRLRICRVKDFLDPVTSRPATTEDINTNLGTNLGILEIMEIRGWLGQLLRKYNNRLNESMMNFNDFMFKPAKGTRKIRKTLQNENREIRDHNFIKYYTSLLGVNIEIEAKTVFPLWKTSYIGYDFSNFIFRYVNNGINTRDRLSHFSNVNPNCPLCISTGTVPVQRDSSIHAFVECKSINKLWNDYFKWINLDSRARNLTTLKLVGYKDSTAPVNKIVNIDLFLVRFFFMKIRNLSLRLVNFGALKTFLIGNRATFAATSSKYRAGIHTTAMATELVISTS